MNHLLSPLLSASPFPTMLKLHQKSHGSPLCSGEFPWQPCSSCQPDTRPLFTEDPVIKRFLAWDRNLRMSDKIRGTSALPGAVESFLNPWFYFSLQPDAFSFLFGGLVVSCSIDRQPCLFPPAPLRSVLKACPFGCWHIKSPLLTALGEPLCSS